MTPHEEHAFSSEDEAQLAYRSLSALAIVGFALGLLSGLVFLTPYLGLLPWVGAVVSFAAARSVSAAPDSRSGLGLAVAGLFLSVAIGSAAYAREFVLDRRHGDDAAEVAEEFLSRLSSGDESGAIELTVAYGERLPSNEAARLYYETDESARDVMRSFVEAPVIAALSSNAKPKLARALSVSRGRFGRVSARLLYEAPEGAGSSVLLTLERTSPRGDASPSWRVSEFKFAE